ncbi:MAG: glycosyltransferase family 4 protein [Chloroflexi bacterium]|nr:glycosyltransferase family 4 protein [Chloroflexota bacterium]
MRIGLVIYGSLDQATGGYLYDRALVETLRAHGHQIRIVSLTWRNYPGLLRDNFSATLFNQLRHLKVDLLLQDELNHPSLFYLNERLKREISYPLVSIVHMVRSRAVSPSILNWFARRIERRYLNSVDGFIFNSLETKQLVESMVKEAKPSVVATPGGDRFKPKLNDVEIKSRARQPGPLRVLFLGNLTRNKAPHLLIEAAAKLEFDSIYVTLAGRQDIEPVYLRYLQRLVKRCGMEGWVYFSGHLDGKLLAATLRTSQVLVVPSSYEGFGIAYLEGLGFGLPAIGTRAAGAKEVIQHGKNGFLIPVGDADHLARYLRRLHQDRKLLARMSLAAHSSFRKFPGWKQSMERVERFLTSYNQLSRRIRSPRRKK